MEIQSAFNSGVQGFKNAQEQASQAASDIAQAENFNEQSFQASEKSVANDVVQVPKTDEIPDLNQNIVELKVAEFQAKASANVVKTADETLGTLLDVTV